MEILYESKQPDSVERIATYLGELGEEDFEIVLEFGGQLVRKEPSVALVLFTNEGDAEHWPRAQIYDMFRQNSAPREMRTSLLEHYIFEWKDSDNQVNEWPYLTHFMMRAFNSWTNSDHPITSLSKV